MKLFHDRPFETVGWFGVKPDTLDPMLVKISNRSEIYPRQVEIYTVSSGVRFIFR